ncbi:MAG: hypothetical protein E6Q97_11250 [Desulfurellales bacterium]|nr:MAG: hypothetical protein E6Q97_11250 [Desulfurellales bacterium]
MARKPTGTEVIDWEKEMEAQAAIAAEAQRSTGGGGGKFFSTAAGVLSWDGTPMPGNRMVVVVLADIIENSYYDGPYDPSTPTSPVCFAFAKNEGDLEPHTAVDNDPYFTRQNDVCNGCPQNEWGSAATGKGKACKNVMRLGIIPAGTFSEKGSGRNKAVEFDGLIDDEDHYATAEEAFLKLPVMSVKNYANFVKQVAADLKRPPHGVFTEIWIEPDPKSQYKVMFEPVDKIPNELLKVVMDRHNKLQPAMNFPYSPPSKEDADQPKTSASNNKLRRKK